MTAVNSTSLFWISAFIFFHRCYWLNLFYNSNFSLPWSSTWLLIYPFFCCSHRKANFFLIEILACGHWWKKYSVMTPQLQSLCLQTSWKEVPLVNASGLTDPKELKNLSLAGMCACMCISTYIYTHTYIYHIQM